MARLSGSLLDGAGGFPSLCAVLIMGSICSFNSFLTNSRTILGQFLLSVTGLTLSPEIISLGDYIYLSRRDWMRAF